MNTEPSKTQVPGSDSRAAGSRSRAPRKKPGLTVPPILLEGDSPSTPSVSGPGQRYALRPAPESEAVRGAPPAELPESYGTKRLLLTARDPHWLYAHWDLTREQLLKYNSLSADRHLVLRVYQNDLKGGLSSEIHVHPESRNWFVNVREAGAAYLGELGYYLAGGKWVRISVSGATVTPPDKMSEDTSVWFESLPVELRLEQLLKVIKIAAKENLPLMKAIQQLRASGYPGLPEPGAVTAGRWTAEQDAALAQALSLDDVRRLWMGSLEITELVRRHLRQELSSAAAMALPAAWSGVVSSISSPFGLAERQRGFWFNVNAELIIYGATEPNAQVTLAGRKIQLRPDGTFSYRFALPDGDYRLPAWATSADGVETRCADLQFGRQTAYAGDVGVHPQDPKLKPPRAENVG